MLASAKSTKPSYTLPPGAMTVTSAKRLGRGVVSGAASHAVISALRGSCSVTTLKKTSPWAFLTVAMAVSISPSVRGSKGWERSAMIEPMVMVGAKKRRVVGEARGPREQVEGVLVSQEWCNCSSCRGTWASVFPSYIGQTCDVNTPSPIHPPVRPSYRPTTPAVGHAEAAGHARARHDPATPQPLDPSTRDKHPTPLICRAYGVPRATCLSQSRTRAFRPHRVRVYNPLKDDKGPPYRGKCGLCGQAVDNTRQAQPTGAGGRPQKRAMVGR